MVVTTGLLALGSQSRAADLALPVTGNLLGSVMDSAGTPQLGASVQLFNRYERLVARTITAPDGRFAFAGLPIDSYSVRVSLASFLPAFRDGIAVKGGSDSVLQIHLATLFSNIELSYTVPSGAMSNDWKWVLRSSPATRPITRFLPEEESASAALRPKVFSGTHAMLSVSGGESGLLDPDSTQGDLGTGFALSTNVLGKNQLQVAGTYGQNTNFGPAAMGLCAIYSRNADGGFGNPPEVTLTVLQLSRFGESMGSGQLAGSNGPAGAAPTLRTMSLSVYEVADPLDNVHLEYGMTGESVDYLQHASRVSPFLRTTVQLGGAGEFILAYNDGGRPDELTAHQGYESAEADAPAPVDLDSAVNSLARLPQISNRNNRLELERSQDYELGYQKKSGSRTYAASAFYENVSNGRLTLAGDVSSLDPEDVLFDGISKTSTYNIGQYTRRGYLASVDQQMNSLVDMAVAYGRMGGFTSADGGLAVDGAAQGRFLQSGTHNVASANLNARTRFSGTRFSASYGWMDPSSIIPRHVFTTQLASIAPGLNFAVRQPLPSFFGMPGHLEVTADLRNLLAQGYVALGSTDGRSLLIVQAPRAIRGGLNFTF
ncbi:MAG TPA: TonB-dependent receptor [Bryobacteraceae bacterium]